MGFMRKRKSLLGIDIGADSIKAIELTQSGDETILTGYGQVEVPHGADQADALSDLLKSCNFQSRRVASSVSGRSVIVRFIPLADVPDANLKQAIRFEADKYIPFELDEVVMDCARLESGGQRFFHDGAQPLARDRREFKQHVPCVLSGERIARAGRMAQHELEPDAGHHFAACHRAAGALLGQIEQPQRSLRRRHANERGLPRPRVRPRLARPHEAQVGEAAVGHRPRREADVLAELRLDQDDRGSRGGRGSAAGHRPPTIAQAPVQNFSRTPA